MGGPPPSRGPIRTGRWYIEPVHVEAKLDGSASYQARQGDIYTNALSTWIESRPVRVARDFQPSGVGARLRYTAVSEDQIPTQPFDWTRNGEQIVVRAMKSFGVLMTQDCELEKPKPMLTFAFVRLFDESHHAADIEAVRNRGKYRSFYLEEQLGDLPFPRAYIDFGRLTSVHPSAVAVADRHLSMADDVRDTMREDFIAFLNLDREGEAEGS